jgi:alpha-2-macroglobulin
VPPDAVPGSVKQHIYLSSSALGPILGNFHSLIDYPYGCTEQTMSKLMPSVVAMRMNQTLGLPLSKEEKKKFGEVYKQSMQKLDGYQHEDGGWGWWANDESNMNLTALVLDGYKLLKDAGYKVEKEREDNGKNWLVTNCATLHKQLTDPMTKQPSEWQIREHSIDMAKAYNVLSQYGVKTPANIKKWALDRRNKSTPEVLAFYAMAFQRQGDVEAARAMYDRLVELGNVTTGDAGTLLDWAPSARMMKLIDPSVDTKNHYYSYRYTDIETTALALEATLMVDPQNSDRIENVKRWILMQRGIDGWSNTKTTSEVFRAFMASELNQRAAGMTTDFTADITVGSGPRRDETSAASLIRPIAFGSASVLEQEKDILVKSKPGSESKIAIHKKGAGKLYYTVLTTYYKAIKPGDFVAQKGMPDGLKLRREFFRLTPSKPDSEGRVKFTAQALPDKKIRAGETLLMKVYVEAPTELPYTFLKAPLPSGAEVVENDSRADEASSDEANSNPNDEGYSWGNWWWTHQDVMDDHLAFFVTDMNRGRLEFHQMVRMEIPGKFQMNPVYLEGMYTKAVRAHSGADTITVTE